MTLQNVQYPVNSATPTLDWVGNADNGAGAAVTVPVQIVITPTQSGISQLTILYTVPGEQQRGIVTQYRLSAVPVQGTGTTEQNAARAELAALLTALLPIVTGVR